MIKDEFIKNYCNSSKASKESFIDSKIVCLPCECDYSKCEGWAMVSNNELSIKTHKDLYTPNK